MSDAIYLKAENRSKSAKAEEKALRTLHEMLEAGEKVSFYSVAKKSGLSRNFLYTNAKIRAAVTELRSDQDSPTPKDDLAKAGEFDSLLIYYENARQKKEIEQLKAKIMELEQKVRVLNKCLLALDDATPKQNEAAPEKIVVPF